MAGVVNQPLPAGLGDLLRDVAALLQVPALEVFGGAARDLLADPGSEIRDVDIAVRGDWYTAREHAKRLAELPDVTWVTPVRDYWVHYRRPVSMFDASWRGIVLDVNVMDHPPQSHFDVDTVTWHWPMMTWDDPYAVVGRPVTALRLATALDSDNPILLLNRVIKLAAKYDLDMTAERRTAALVAALTARAAQWTSADDFHGRQAHDSHLRAVHAATLRARDPAGFLILCANAGVLDARLTPLAVALREWNAAATDLAARCTPFAFWATADRLVGDETGSWRTHERWLATKATALAIDGGLSI